jgi:hypothetical protein
MLDDTLSRDGYHAPPLPWPVAEAIWTHLYAALGHGDQSLERIAERGGFSYREIEVMANELRKRRERKKDR